MHLRDEMRDVHHLGLRRGADGPQRTRQNKRSRQGGAGKEELARKNSKEELSRSDAKRTRTAIADLKGWQLESDRNETPPLYREPGRKEERRGTGGVGDGEAHREKGAEWHNRDPDFGLQRYRQPALFIPRRT